MTKVTVDRDTVKKYHVYGYAGWHKTFDNLKEARAEKRKEVSDYGYGKIVKEISERTIIKTREEVG